MSENYTLRKDNTAEMRREGLTFLLRIPYIADHMPIVDVKRVNKAVRTSFTPYIYIRWLRDLNQYIQHETYSYRERYHKISPLIIGELKKYE